MCELHIEVLRSMILLVEPGLCSDISYQNNPFLLTYQALDGWVNSLTSNSCTNSCVFGIIASSTNRLSILFAREQVLLNFRFERSYSPFVTLRHTCWTFTLRLLRVQNKLSLWLNREFWVQLIVYYQQMHLMLILFNLKCIKQQILVSSYMFR
jgi:hypothetical protein